MRVLRTGMGALLAASMVFRSSRRRRRGRIRRTIKLSGFDEVPVVITDASGQLRVKIAGDQTSIDYTLSYQDIETVTCSRPTSTSVSNTPRGGIVVWLCANVPPANPPITIPTPPLCPVSPRYVSGTPHGGDVISFPRPRESGRGIWLRSSRPFSKDVAYGNVHTNISTSGAIRGQFRGKH